ncbi:DUF6782 family putative metallopeptidase [Marivita hallyeonensis]|uniref:DUF6782 family putative metallopeptidase n=1 Tax=Marivita hallyeonensis TaxID=996342 RepID=UPI001C4A70C0|nr:DUF6782 family putative metallopeptidase [Marivita hallyeonensis]
MQVHAETVCADPPFDSPEPIARVVEATSEAISGFAGLEMTLSSAIREICIADKLHAARGYFEPEARRIVLAPDLEGGLPEAVMVHELRHAEQYALGLCPSLSLAMRDYAQAIFAMEADASVASLVVAARLKESGNDSMWEAISRWPMQSDVAAAFETRLEETDSLSQAAQAGFDAWFANEQRTDVYYVSSCLDYLDRTEEAHLLPQYDRVAPEFLDQLCTLPDGTPYQCALPED